MPDPAATARRVLETHGVTGIPALFLPTIARSETIKFLFRALPSTPNLAGQLLYKGDQKGIIVNTCKGNTGRHNFTFAHELGHYFLRHPPTFSADGQSGFLCSIADVGSGQKQIEREADNFAAALLMPEASFRPLTAGAPLDFTLIDSLAREFQVSKHACSNRILDFTHEPYAVINSKGFAVTACKLSRAARGYLHGLKEIPEGTAARTAISAKRNQQSFAKSDPQIWHAKSGSRLKLYEWTRGRFDNGVAMTILRWQGT